mmetsp:Transcript_28956/g.63752  ORF Transcript_28956/g.63752 Transcript_28956/m.63752 type:complete len:88 (+) Transcript_28956:846-1109(+)
MVVLRAYWQTRFMSWLLSQLAPWAPPSAGAWTIEMDGSAWRRLVYWYSKHGGRAAMWGACFRGRSDALCAINFEILDAMAGWGAALS